MKASSHSNVGFSDCPLKYRGNACAKSGPLKIDSSQFFFFFLTTVVLNHHQFFGDCSNQNWLLKLYPTTNGSFNDKRK